MTRDAALEVAWLAPHKDQFREVFSIYSSKVPIFDTLIKIESNVLSLLLLLYRCNVLVNVAHCATLKLGDEVIPKCKAHALTGKCAPHLHFNVLPCSAKKSVPRSSNFFSE